MNPHDSLDTNPGAGSTAVLPIILVMMGLMIAGAMTFFLLRKAPSPPPAAIAKDPLLVQGRELYLARCVSCHRTSGRGDGPIAKGLSGPPPGDLTDEEWKHGDQPEQVLGVVTQGVKDTAMPGWKGTFSPEEIRAVSAYVYYLAGRKVPESFRTP